MTLWTTSEVYKSDMNMYRLGVTKKEGSKHSHLVLGWMGKCQEFQRTLKENDTGKD